MQSMSQDNLRPEQDSLNLATEGIKDQLSTVKDQLSTDQLSFVNIVHASTSGLVRRGHAVKSPEMREMRLPDRSEAVEDVVPGGGATGASRSLLRSGNQSMHESADDSQVSG
jgi:hypothetical protein